MSVAYFDIPEVISTIIEIENILMKYLDSGEDGNSSNIHKILTVTMFNTLAILLSLAGVTWI